MSKEMIPCNLTDGPWNVDSYISLTSCLLIPWFASYQVFPLGIDSLRKVNAELLNPAVFFLRAVEGPQAHEGQGQ